MRLRAFSRVLVLILSPWALSQNEAAVSTSVTMSSGSPALNQTIGWEFTAIDNLLVTHLGQWDDNLDGLDSNHTVGIFDLSMTLLVSTTMSGGTTHPLVSNFRYITLASPVLLSAGENYIVAYISNVDPEGFIRTSVPGGSVNLHPSVTFIKSRFHLNGFSFPESDFPTSDILVGPTFGFDVVVPVTLDGDDLVISVGSSGSTLTVTSDVTNGNLIISDPGQALATDVAGSSGSGTNTLTIPFSSFSGQLNVGGGSGDDVLNVDFSLGSFPFDIDFTGGDQSLGDSLGLTGGSLANVTFTATDEGSGSVDVDGRTITYSGLE